MKVVAINGSPRSGGNTSRLIRIVLDKLGENGIETDIMQLGGKPVRGCRACYKCAEQKDKRCTIKSDQVNACIEKMLECEGMLLGSPTYFSNVTSEMKALIDRAGIVSKVNGDMLKRKVGAAVIAVRRAGSIQAFNAINQFYTINQMIIPGSNYWNMGIGKEKGDVEWDQEGMVTMEILGENFAWLLHKLND